MTTTRLRRAFRLSAAAALVCLLAASWLTFTAPSASAFEQERLFLEKDGSISVEFPAIRGNNATGEAQDNETCKTSPYCDTIPVTIKPDPTVTEDSEYFVVVTVSWDTAKAPPDPVLAPSEGLATNDMDTYMYQVPITDKRHTNETGEDYMAHSAGSEEPERFFMFKPRGDYELVVINYLGINQGYTVDMTWVSESFDAPFESLAPGFTPPSRPAAAAPTPIAPTPTVAPPLASPSAPVVDAPVTLTPGDIDLGSADDGFGQFDSDSDFDDQLAAPAPIDLTPASATKAAPPSGLALLLWFFAFPLLLMAVFSGVLLRRRAMVVTA
jgi:hypothetical protein